MTKLFFRLLRYHRALRATGEISLVLLIMSGALMIFNQPVTAPATALDPLQTRVRTELGDFTNWLAATGSRGYIGEVGWPDNTGGDAASWNALADIWFKEADQANLWVTPWSAGTWWGTSYKLSAYQDKLWGAGVDSSNTQASVIEKHPSTAQYRRGINVSGAEFGTDKSFNNANSGTLGVDYIYEPTGTFKYLASRGETIIRLPLRWERIQSTPGGPLDTTQLQQLTDTVNRAGASGLGVIIDLHNYGEYQTASGRQTIGRGVSIADYTDLWLKLSQAFKDNPAVAAYDIMNEPHDLGGPDPTKTWEQASQGVLSAIRSNGDNKLIMIPGYNWSGAATWRRTHPVAWINDPSHNFRYEAHHYWDADHTGKYPASYASEVSKAMSTGYGTKPGPPSASLGLFAIKASNTVLLLSMITLSATTLALIFLEVKLRQSQK